MARGCPCRGPICSIQNNTQARLKREESDPNRPITDLGVSMSLEKGTRRFHAHTIRLTYILAALPEKARKGEGER